MLLGWVNAMVVLFSSVKIQPPVTLWKMVIVNMRKKIMTVMEIVQLEKTVWVNVGVLLKWMNAEYAMVQVKQENVDVKISQMEPVTVTAMYWMNVGYVVEMASQMEPVTARAM